MHVEPARRRGWGSRAGLPGVARPSAARPAPATLEPLADQFFPRFPVTPRPSFSCYDEICARVQEVPSHLLKKFAGD